MGGRTAIRRKVKQQKQQTQQTKQKEKKKKDSTEEKTKRIPRKKTNPKGTAFNVGDFAELMQENVSKKKQKSEKQSTKKPKEVKTENKDLFEIKELNINGDYRRVWNETFKNAGECLTKRIESIPIPL